METNRKQFITSFGFGIAGLSLAACSSSKLVPTPLQKADGSPKYSIRRFSPTPIDRAKFDQLTGHTFNVVAPIDGGGDGSYGISPKGNFTRVLAYNADHSVAAEIDSTQYPDLSTTATFSANGFIVPFQTPVPPVIVDGVPTQWTPSVNVTVESGSAATGTATATDGSIYSISVTTNSGGDMTLAYVGADGSGYSILIPLSDLDVAIQTANTGKRTADTACQMGANEEECAGAVMAVGGILAATGVGAPAGLIAAGIGGVGFLIGFGIRMANHCKN